MRDPRKYQPAISQQPPQNVVLFNSGPWDQTNYRPRQVGYRESGVAGGEVRLGRLRVVEGSWRSIARVKRLRRPSAGGQGHVPGLISRGPA